jgi:hypothetical protein
MQEIQIFDGKKMDKNMGLEKMGLDNMENDVKKTLFWCPICLLFELSPLTKDHDWLLVSNTSSKMDPIRIY